MQINKYVIGYVSFHDNQVLLTTVLSTSKEMAIAKYLEVDIEDYPTLVDLETYAFNGDSSISILEL